MLPSVCNPGNPTFYNLSLTFTEGLVDVTVKGAGREGRSQLPFFLGQERLLLTVGNIPRKLLLLLSVVTADAVVVFLNVQ